MTKNQISELLKVDSHDLEGAAGCVEELDLSDAPLRDGV